MKNYLLKKSQKWAGGVAQGIGPEYKPQYCKNVFKNLHLPPSCILSAMETMLKKDNVLDFVEIK
jgi:hypothetical protein